MPLTTAAEQRLTEECERLATGIVDALREIDQLDGITPTSGYDYERINRAIRRSHGLTETTPLQHK